MKNSLSLMEKNIGKGGILYNKRKFSLGICILTWNKPKTLKNTLKSYEKFGLLDIVTEKIILCQENNQDEMNIAKSFGFTTYHTEKNIGIGKGISLLTKNLHQNI